MSGLICLFAKPPVPGQVKTRLAAAVGPERACELATAFLDDTLATLARLPEETALATTALDGAFPEAARGLRRWPQGEGDLGARLTTVLTRALEQARWAIAVGADSPGLPVALHRAAARTLDEGARAVLGPSLDGGFYLIGLSAVPPGLFDAIPWSTPDAGRAMLHRLRRHGLDPVVLPPWFDVDELADLERLGRLIDDGRVAAPATAAALGHPRPERATTTPSRLSAIVPTLNEAPRIGALVARLVADPAIAEVIVVDGGSDDDTLARARAAGAHATLAPRGRAAQLNAGASLATGDHLIFVHADVMPPPDVGRRVLAALSDPGVALGAFTTWTSLEGARSWLGPLVHLADVRSRVTRHPYGDQAMCVRRADFDAVGGFPAQPLMEDFELSRRLVRRGRLARLGPAVVVSGRRLVERPLLTTLLWNVFPTLYRLGVDPHLLARLYADTRAPGR